MLGGAPADPTLLVRARDAGWPVAPTYGLTQACSAVTVAQPGDTETSGHPLPGMSVDDRARRRDRRRRRACTPATSAGSTSAGA